MAGVAIGGVAGLLARNLVVAVIVGVAVTALVVTVRAIRSTTPGIARQQIDPFTVGEPWRQYVQTAQNAQRRFQTQIEDTPAGPISDYLVRVSDDLDNAIADIWNIAQAGDRTTSGIRELDPTRLRSKLARLRTEAEGNNDPNLDDSITSMESQIATVDRLEQQSTDTASRLRLEITRLEELVSKAVLVSTGELPQQRFDSDVGELVRSLQALNEATEDVGGS